LNGAKGEFEKRKNKGKRGSGLLGGTISGGPWWGISWSGKGGSNLCGAIHGEVKKTLEKNGS